MKALAAALAALVCGTAAGALAGLAVGVWDSLEDLASNWHLDREFTPVATPAGANQRYAGWKRAVDRARA